MDRFISKIQTMELPTGQPTSFEELLDRIPDGELVSKNRDFLLIKTRNEVYVYPYDANDPTRVNRLEIYISQNAHSKRGSLLTASVEEYYNWILENFKI